jgi:hypothetical protein
VVRAIDLQHNSAPILKLPFGVEVAAPTVLIRPVNLSDRLKQPKTAAETYQIDLASAPLTLRGCRGVPRARGLCDGLSRHTALPDRGRSPCIGVAEPRPPARRRRIAAKVAKRPRRVLSGRYRCTGAPKPRRETQGSTFETHEPRSSDGQSPSRRSMSKCRRSASRANGLNPCSSSAV